MSPMRRLVYSILALIGVLVIGTAGYMYLETEAAPSLLDAAYMTAITVTTVGYGEVWPLSPAGKLWSIVVILVGVATVSLAFTSLVSMFVSGEIRYATGRRIVQRAISHLKDHVIVCGFGRMGSLAVVDLHKFGTSLVVVERNKDLEPELLRTQIPYIIGDATDEETLLAAGLRSARLLVTTLPEDADNVFVTLTVHTLQPNLQIVARAEQPSTQVKLERAGASRVICPKIIGAHRITAVITQPNVVDFFDVANKGVDLEMDEYVIAPGSPLAGVSLRDSKLRQQTGASVVAIKRVDGATLYNPEPSINLQAGDTLIFVGPSGVSEKLDRLEPDLRPD